MRPYVDQRRERFGHPDNHGDGGCLVGEHLLLLALCGVHRHRVGRAYWAAGVRSETTDIIYVHLIIYLHPNMMNLSQI